MKLLASLILTASLAVSAFSVHANTAAPAEAASAPAAVKAEPKKPAKPDLAQGEAKFTAVCAACHGADGNSGTPTFPKLAQQHPEYIIKQLKEFKSGTRNNAVMKGFASTLSDDDMRNIAFWVSAKTSKPGFAKEKELVTLGEKIYRGGIADRRPGRGRGLGCAQRLNQPHLHGHQPQHSHHPDWHRLY